MKSVYMRNLYMSVVKKKKIIGISILVFTILMGIAGVIKYMNIQDGYTEEELEDIREYEEVLKGYDEAIDELRENLKIAREQLKVTEDYCLNSVYMKLDAQKIHVSTVQYAVQTTGGVGNILGSLVSYINDGSMKEEIIDRLDGIPIEYLKELISCSISNNVLIVSAMHYDEGTAEKIIHAISEQLEEHTAQISSIQGEYTLVLLDASNSTKADPVVMNAQNANLNNYKANQNSVANLVKTLADQQSARYSYVDRNQPEEPESNKSITIILKYLIFGIILGTGVPFSFYGLQYAMSDQVKGAKELSASGMNVLGIYKMKGENEGDKEEGDKIERDVMDIGILADQKDCRTLYLDILGNSSMLEHVSETFAEQLESRGIHTRQSVSMKRSVEELKKMIEVGHCIMVVEVGSTSYRQLEEEMQLCRKFHVDVWGCVVVE